MLEETSFILPLITHEMTVFFNKKYPIIIQTRPSQIVKEYYLLKNRFLKINGSQNQVPITCGSDLVCNKTLKARNSTPPHTTILTFNILIAN